jgi:hypothetical protein
MSVDEVPSDQHPATPSLGQVPTQGGSTPSVSLAQAMSSASPSILTQTLSSPTYATLTPVQVTPPAQAPGQGQAPFQISGLGTDEDFTTVHKRNRNRFAKKSTPYPPQ